MFEIIAQAIGILGMIFAFLSFQCKKTRNFFIGQALSGLSFCVNFFMLGSPTGAFLNLINIGRGCGFGLAPKRYKTLVGAVVFIAYIAITVLTYESWISVLVLLAQLAGTVSMYSGKGKLIRIIQFFIVSPFWLIHNVWFWSLGGILCESFNLISVIISVIRYGISGFDEKE